MNILVCGASGFIGRHIASALTAAGHKVTRGMRQTGIASDIAIDYTQDVTIEAWLPRLKNIDVVINAVGILVENRQQQFQAIHRDAPIALFDACAQTGVKKVIQISALGGATVLTPYMQTKRDADAHLMASRLDWTILRPSLVVGTDGDSSKFFRLLASLPVIGLPGDGAMLLQPVHIDDLCAAVIQVLAPAAQRRVINVVGPDAMSYRAMLNMYRERMKMAAAVWLPVPMPIMRISAIIAAKLPQRVFAPDTLRMLEANNVADPADITQLLGRPPTGSDSWFAGIPAEMLRMQAVASWTVPMLRVALALVWIVSGILSLGIYPVSDSLALLAQAGLHGTLALNLLFGSAALDCVIGVATLIKPCRLLWRAQIALIIGFSLIIAIYLPEYLLHPFGPILKNIPILALLLLLDSVQAKKD